MEGAMDGIAALCDCIRETAYAIHVYLGPGHFESVYERALIHRLRKLNLEVDSQARLEVFDEDGTRIGECVADLLVQRSLIVELKAAKQLAPDHTAQVLGYLRASRHQHALLLNFGAAAFQIREFTCRPIQAGQASAPQV
jgi:GxxExxY protein